MVVMWTKKSRHVRIAGWEGCTSGKGIRCSSTAVSMPGFAANADGLDATAAAAEVSGDGAWGTLLALPSCTRSSVSSIIPSMILEVDATFNVEHFARAGTTALRCALRVVQWPLLAGQRPLTPTEPARISATPRSARPSPRHHSSQCPGNGPYFPASRVLAAVSFRDGAPSLRSAERSLRRKAAGDERPVSGV